MRRLLIVLLLTVGCLGSSQEVQIANWPHGYKSAVSITFDTELATRGQIEEVISTLDTKNATFFVVAGYFEDRPEDLEPLKEYDVASMAWAQWDWEHSDLSETFQLNEMQRADSWLVKNGFSPKGFRAPFLRDNENTIRAVRAMGYAYDSSQKVGAMPYMVDGVVEIPLSLDFDVLWNENSMKYSTLPLYLTFDETYKNDGLFTFYSHVQKASENTGNLSAFLNYASARHVWFANADQVAQWWILRSNLELTVDGTMITVKNNGDKPVSGVTVKISPGREVNGALYTWGDESTTYAILPILEPGEEALLL